MGICRYCNQNAGFLRKQHGQCRDLHSQGIREMTQLAAQAAGTASFDETALRNTLQAIASRARATPDDVSQAIADGWLQGISHALSDGTLTHEEETASAPFGTDSSPGTSRPSPKARPPWTGPPGPASPPRADGPPSPPGTEAEPSRSWTTPSVGP